MMQTTTEQIKERPILFSGEMVRAILEGRKTQTRRVVKFPAPYDLFNEQWKSAEKIAPGEFVFWSGEMPPQVGLYIPGEGIKCPYGKPGDRLWVRETWGHEYGGGYLYRASQAHMIPGYARWRTSIHMPRAASRILLEIADVRVERLHDISEQDAIAEGVESWTEDRLKSKPTHYKIYYQDTPQDPAFYSSSAKVSFETLWQSINGPESWANNPFAWVITFKRIQP